MNKSQNYIKKLCAEYLEIHCKEQERDLLIGENNIEIRDVKGYHGREILELLQNADDAYEDKKNKGGERGEGVTVLIKFFENKLTVSNSGTTFDENGIKAIVQGNNSSKEKGKYIGNKGTGFRSILNWATKVEIYSGEFNILFSKDISKKELDKIKHLPQISKQINKSPDLYIPMLSLPQYIDKINTGYDTSIIIDINEDLLNDGFGVTEQIENIDLRILLFLPNICKIIIELENRKIEYERIFDCSNNFNEVRLIKRLNGYVQTSESFYVFKKIVKNVTVDDDIKNNILLSIAVPKNFRNYDSSNMYTFFPLKNTESPFRCVLHASFELDDNRNNINYNTTNKIIIENLMRFLKDVSFKFVKHNYGDVALKLLIPINFTTYNWKFPAPFSHFNLETFYLNLMKDINFLQTVNDEYISVSDSPKLLNNKFPSVFCGSNFLKLIKHFSDELLEIKVFEFVKKIAETVNVEIAYKENELLNIVNNFTNQLSPVQHVEIFSWWNNTYRNSLPNLLKKQDGTWLSFNDECYLLEGDVSSNIPSWVKVPSISLVYQEKLLEHIDNNEKNKGNTSSAMIRKICQDNIFPLVNFLYRDRRTIVRTVNSSVDNYEKAIEFIKWLWINYASDADWTPLKDTGTGFVNYNFPNFTNKKVFSSFDLYIGSSYKNFLASKLFFNDSGELPPPNYFINENENIDDFINFISKFGVRKYPKIQLKEITPISLYNDIHKKNIMTFQKSDLGRSSYIEKFEYKLSYIQNLEKILENFETKHIIKWLFDDSTLNLHLKTYFYSEGVSIRFRGNLQTHFRVYRNEIRNYILFLFNNLKWIEIKNIKYAPNEVLSEFSTGINLHFSELIPVLTIENVEKIADELGLQYQDVENIFNLFELCKNPTHLKSNDFYGFLLKLQEHEHHNSVKMYKSLYRIIEKHDFSVSFDNSENKSKFFEHGKVLVKHNGEIQYFVASESFVPSSKIVNKNNFPILEKGLRTSNKYFLDIFGCQEYNRSYEIIEDSIIKSDADLEFQNYYKDFKRFAFAYREKNLNIENYTPQLEISLVKSITLDENGKKVNVSDDYMTIRKSNTQWYIFVSSTNFDIKKLSLEIEVIYANIANTQGFDEGKLGELFRAETTKDREFLIEKEFGTLDVIGDTFYKNNIKNNFINTVKNINNQCDIDLTCINFNDFDSINSCKYIISILVSLNTDIQEFKKLGFVYPIDLRQYYKQYLRNYIRSEKNNYTNYIFTEALNDIEKQDSFLIKCDEFENFELEVYENSIYFDIKNAVSNKFGTWKNTYTQNACEAYKTNYEKLNPDNLFQDEIANNYKVKTIIYFNREAEFREWSCLQESNKNSSMLNSSNDEYELFRNTIPQKENIEYSNKKHSHKTSGRMGKGTYTASSNMKKQKNKKILGNKGELLVYNLLCSEYGSNNVFPRSESFVELGMLKSGQAVSGQFDISYVDADGNEIFVEVKTGDSQFFIMSVGELAFAKQNAEQFELYLIYDIESEPPKYRILPKKFWESKKFKLDEVIERIEVNF